MHVERDDGAPEVLYLDSGSGRDRIKAGRSYWLPPDVAEDDLRDVKTMRAVLSRVKWPVESFKTSPAYAAHLDRMP